MVWSHQYSWEGLIRSTQLLNRQLRDMLVFVFLDQYTNNFHERSEWVRLVFSDFIDQAVEQCNQPLKLGFGMGDEYGVSQRRPRIYRFAHVEILHRLLLPLALIVFGVGKHGADIDFLPVVVNRGN